jgi:uncharacterized LabA/DUF88 family protein
MSRVALFFDGKNHMKDLRLAAEDRWIDHGALAQWVVEHVGGTELVGAHYYTGVPTPADDANGRGALSDLLNDLERKPGFFVHRFQRVASSWVCSNCNHAEPFTREKQVDTSLVADMILMAVHNVYDIAVVFSGDLDLAPAIEAAHSLGKKAWVATFGQVGISRSLQRSAWGMIDLRENLDVYAHTVVRENDDSLGDPTASDADVLRELARAQAHFQAGGGFVGTQYFLHRWRGQGVSDDPERRRLAVERLMLAGLIDRYEVQGRSALRVVGKVAPRVLPEETLLVEDEE